MVETNGTTTRVLLLDVNETLTDMSGLDGRFAAALPPGVDAALVRGLWFARVLRDGFALTAVGRLPVFAELAQEQCVQVLAASGADDPAAGAADVMAGVPGLDLHPDVAPGLRAMAEAGYRLVPFTNGSTDSSTGPFERGGVLELFQTRLSVTDAGAWKPARSAYAWAAGRLGADPARCTLVAVHPWDVMGAREAGLATAWVSRGAPWPSYLQRADVEATDLVGLAARLPR